ncbi:A-kinase anchor protein 12 [Danio aesculapii]|uniref:A-kinase anchor protein 12 n=1 Tax=Danio aesculapii TaxID=1142201 RepID=UPI0024BFAEDF|nr:A-kinase anchor protein 12 [Danio aesculapii]
MGAATSSARRDSRGEEDAAAEELTAAGSDAPEDGGAADDKLLQTNGQISNLNAKTKDPADELNCQFEDRVLADVSSGFVTLKEDGTETLEDLQNLDSLQPNTKNESSEMVNAGVNLKEETEVDNQVNDINEVGFKRIFRFVGFKLTLKKDTCEKTQANEQKETEENELKEADASEDAKDEDSDVAAIKITPDETHKIEVSSDAAEPPSQQTDNETEPDQDIKIVDFHVVDTPGKEMEKESSLEPEEPMSPIKQFFTQGIFASLRKKKKEEEIQKESKEEELKENEKKIAEEETEKQDSKCMCLDIPYIISEEGKDSQEKGDDSLLPEGELQNSLEKDRVQGSPLKRLFRKFSSRRQREGKAVEKVVEVEEQVSEQPKPSSEVTELGKAEEPLIGEPIIEEPTVREPKPADEEPVGDVGPQESKKKSDTTVSWEALICGGSAKKRARKTNENEMTGQEQEKVTDSPLGSSIEGDYDHLTSSNEQTGSPAEGEVGSTWKTFKKMVTPKRKVRPGESSTPEQIPSDGEMSKDELFSMKKLIPGHKKRKSEARQDQTSSDEAAKDHESDDEDDETPAIIPLSEYEVIEPETLKEMNEQRVEITIEHEMPEIPSQALEKDTFKVVAKVSSNTAPAIIQSLSEDFEELTDFLSKHQQLSDIPEEGIIEESIETPVSSAEWTTQDDTLAEDIVELTADAVTAPEPESFFGDDTTEMVSALSQLTESPRSSGHVTPMSAEYDVQTSDAILHEAIQSICMTPSVQSVTTKDESKKTLAVSFSPYIVQSSTPEETKVLVAHKKTEATAICIGLVSQEIESVEKHLPAPLVEAILEVCDTVPTELASDNFTDELEVARFGTDEVYEAEIKNVKTEFQEMIVNEKESTTESEQDRVQVIQLVTEPLVDESEETHIQDKKEESTTGIELRRDIDTKQSESGLDQVMSDNTHGPEMECPSCSADEFECNQLAAAEATLDTLSQVVEQETVNKILDITKATDAPVEDTASAVECPEIKENVNIISPITDQVQVETIVLEDSLQIKDVPSIQADVKDADLSVDNSGDMSIKDIGEKMEASGDEKITQQEIKEDHLEEETGDVVSSEVVQNVKTENISESIDDLLVKEQLPAEKALTEPVSEKVEEAHKEVTDTDVDDNKVVDNAHDRADRIFVKDELSLKNGQPLTDTESNETEYQDLSTNLNSMSESPDIAVGETEKGETEKIIPVVSEFSKDVLESTKTPTEGEVSCEAIPTILWTPSAEVEVKAVPEEIVIFQTEECSQDTQQNEQLQTSENNKTGKVLEMVAIIEKTTKQLEQEKGTVAEPEAQVLTMSELQKATEQEGDSSEITVVHGVAKDSDQAPAVTLTDTIRTDIPDENYKEAVAPILKPERVDSRMTVTEENKANADSMQKCEPLRQITEMTLSKELQVDKADNKDEIPAVTEVIPKEQVPPLRSEVTAEMPDVTVSEVQTKVESALRAATLEVTEPKVEMPVVTEVTVESAVVTELEVERPIVTSVVAELEVETPVVTSTTKTTDTHTSQIIDADTTELTTVIKEHVEKPTVISVVVTPATPLDEVAPVLTQSHESRVLDEVKDASVEPRAIETPKVESVIVRTVVAPVVEIQNVIPVVTAPNLGSIIMTEGSSPVVEATVLETTAATAVKPDVVEIPVVQTPDIDSVIMSPAITSVPLKEVTLDLTSFAETPLDNVKEIPVVSLTSVKPTIAALMQTTDAEIQARVPMTVTEAACPVVVTTDVTPVVPGRIVIPVLEAPHATSSTVVLQTPTQMSVTVTEAEAPITTSVAVSAVIPVEETVRVTETSPPGVVSVTAAVETPATIPVVQTPTVKLSSFAMVETPVVTPVVLMPKQVSEKAKETALSAVISAVETPPVIPAEEYPVVKLTQVAVVEAQAVHPMAETPGQGLVRVTEASPPTIVSDITAAVETPAIISVVETPVVMATPVTNFELPVETPVVEILGLVSETVKETAPPTVVSAVETLPLITVVQTPTVKSTEVPVVEPPVVKLDQVSSLVSETSPPVDVSAVEAPAIIPVVETQVVKSTPVAVIEMPVVTPVVQIPGEVSVIVKETAPPAVVSAVETSAVMTVTENLVLTSTPVSVLDAPAVTPVVQTSCQGSARVIETSPLPVVSGVTAAVEAPIMIPVVETPVVMDEIPIMTKVIQTPSQDLLMVKETAPLVIVSAVETRLAIPVVETPIVTSTQLGAVETTGVLPAVQALAQDSVRETETLPQAIISGVTAAVEVPSMIPVVDIPVAVVEIPVVPPVVQAPGQGSVRVSETSPPSVVSGVTAPVETPAMIPAVETLVVKSPVVAVVETPVVTPVEQTAGQVSGIVKEIVPPADASGVTSREETPAVNSTPVAVVQPPVLTPVVEISEKVSMKVTETSPPAVAETSVLAAVVETAVVKAAPSAVTETPDLTPVVQISEQVSMRVTETSSPVGAETTVLTQVVETSVVKPAPAAVTETPILTPVVQISEQVSVKVTETSPPSVTKTAVLTPVVETPVTKPAAVTETPVMTPMVQSPRQVLVTVTETALPVFASAEKPVVVPVETPVLKPTLVAETPVMTTPILTSVVERSVLSLVLETTAPTTIALTERPVMIPMVQTPALVSVIVKETAPPVVLPPVTTTAEIPVKSPAVETLAVKPTSAVTETPIPVVPITESPVVTPVGEQVAQTPTTPATASVKTPPIGTVMETPAVVSEEKAKQQTEVAEALTLAPVVEAPATPQPVVTPDVKEAIVQVVAEDIKKANTEPSVVFEDAVQQHEVKTSIQKNPKGPMPHEAVVTSTEPQPEIEEDVWEDAVDNIGDSPCQLTHTEDEPQDTAAKQASEAVI